ncbi:RluA family pseudouridine synthase [Nostoc sp. UCD121]|uniref:RluA family pseudouridine synthase n=1 Tax=unclassified Nostoc TaxID=2593658 RepID=UPI001629A4DE|nr:MULTISPECIES: RluA family pseudouridine synthase [unclassified Nostoc]MBC1224639.1 RluA family pseudouridine synthase [Nostoc sp. UCD120]MBC1277150.1 RluA family pseudouridine synthase [Nostoc sp. UCD121]MBC1294894.1 RluA family pseudouridine synthase [Nostoc sp. UCD122]
MVVLHALSDFIDCNFAISDLSPSYWYEGRCLQSGDRLRLPRTSMSEAIAHGLMQQLSKNDCYSREGKMYGVLLVELPNGEQRVLKAFSGLLNGCSLVTGWVPPIPGRDEVALEEARTLAELDAIKQEILCLKQLTERQQYETLSDEFERQLQAMSDRHRHCKHQRQEKRQQICNTLPPETLTIALEQLDEESRQQGIERRQLKRQQNEVLQPLQQLIAATDARISELKQQRKALSRQLQAQMQASYSLTNFLGRSLSLQQLMPGGSPTGTGDCCAPKLLHYAATHNLKPLAMAEFWWGASSVNQDKIPGEFYGACIERCQPLMGFLLSGLRPNPPLPFPGREEVTLPIIYEDEWLIAVNKPAGLLSVPGRYSDRQDSVLSRLRHLLPDGMALVSVHRLDQETSGILLLARDRQTHRQLSQQFQQHQVHKVYEAVLSGVAIAEQGVIDLPLWGDPENRPYQKVDWQNGKPSLTNFQVMVREQDYTRVEFTPLTGRTHQLRVHAADVRGLGIAILGDRLYGCDAVTSRLHLHARELHFEHPKLEKTLYLKAITPF